MIRPLPHASQAIEAIQGPDGEWYSVSPNNRRLYGHEYRQACKAAIKRKIVGDCIKAPYMRRWWRDGESMWHPWRLVLGVRSGRLVRTTRTTKEATQCKHGR